MELLDLSEIPSWLKSTEKIVGRIVPSDVRHQLTKTDPEKMYGDTMCFFLKAAESCGNWKTLDEWCEEFDDAFRARYSHFRGFHSCRAYRGLDTYKEQGIRRLSKKLLRQLAHEVFGDHATRDEIENAVDNADIPSFDEAVYLYTDKNNANGDFGNHYLQSGSEMLQSLTGALGLHSRGILGSQGAAYLIECEVPMDTVDVGFRWEHWRELVTGYFKTLSGAPPLDEPPESCFKVLEDIAPSHIKEFHLVDESLVWSHAPKH